nr:YitT family protein [Clostridioides mangenotii]
MGLGIMFRSDASTGGTDLIALILIKKFPNFKVINLLSGLDGTIVIASGIVNNSIETALYSGIDLLVIVKIADIIVEGFNSSRAFYIISDQPEKVRTAITGELNRGLTILDGKGGYTKTSKEILLVVVTKNKSYF